MTVFLWVAAAITAAAVLTGAILTRHPIRALGSGALQGVCALAAVNVAAMWSGVSLGVTAFSASVAAVLGIPGVIAMLLLQTLCFVPM